MKLSVLLLLFGMTYVSAVTYGQGVSLSVKEASLESVLLSIQRQSGYSFLIKAEYVNRAAPVTLTVENKGVLELLPEIMATQPFDYRVNGQVVTLIPKEPVVKATTIIETAQSSVSGTVKDTLGNPIDGVSVVVKGTVNGTATDKSGYFQISAERNDILEFSIVGYQSVELTIGANRSNLQVVLRPVFSDLDEVVVVGVGYGTLQKSKVSSAMASVNTKNIENQLNVAVGRSLEGLVSGVVVNQNTGAPGGGATIRIRGGGSIGSSNDPLFVIDGIPYANTSGKERSPLSFLNPSDIESMDILKDAAASAIYGSRGANGVVLITTKSGKAGKTEITVDVRNGFQQVMPIEKLDLMNAYEFATWRKENYLENQAYYGLPVNLNDLHESYRNPEFWIGKGFDWQEGLFRTAPLQSYSASVSHGSERFKGYFSMGYTHEEGAIIETNIKRLNTRANMLYEANKFIDFGVMMNSAVVWWGNRVDDNRGGHYGNAIVSSPLDGPYFDEGYPHEDNAYIYDGWDGSIFVDFFHMPNSIYNLKKIRNKAQDFSLNFQPYLQVTPMKGLEFKSQVNLQFSNDFRSSFQPSTNSIDWAPPPAITRGTYGTGKYFSWQFVNSLDYQRTFGNHSIGALLAFTMEHYQGEGSSIDAWDFPNDLITSINASRTQIASTSESAWSLLSSIYRVNYDYKAKYLLQASIRRDGSSRFGSDRRWGYFPAISAGWNVAKEAFFPETDWLTDLKLRSSYGVSGNNNIGDYTWIALLSSINYSFGDQVVPGVTPGGISNTQLGWEKTKEYNLGLDVTLWRGNLHLTFDYYNKITTDMLWSVPIPISSGFNSLWDNIGKVRNSGLEFSLSSVNISTRDFRWNTDFNISFNRNKVLDLGNIDRLEYNGGFAVLNMTRIGEPVAQFWGFRHLGIFNTQEEIDNSATYGTQLPGTPKWEDIDKNGIIDINDRTVIGSPHPAFTGGMSNRLTYKQWDFNVNLSYAHDFDVAAALETTTLNLAGAFNVTKEVKNRWKSSEQPGNGRIGSSFHQSNLDRDVHSSKFIYNVSYLKIQSLGLGYSFNTDYIKHCRLSLSVQNPWLITNYKYGNPDVNRYGNSALMRGIDEYDYPLTRIFALGATITF